MSVKYIALKNGGGCVSELSDSDNDGMVVLKNPVQIAIEQRGLAFVPFNPLISDTEIEIPKEEILYISNIIDEIKNAYCQQFGGVITPSKGLVY